MRSISLSGLLFIVAAGAGCGGSSGHDGSRTLVGDADGAAPGSTDATTSFDPAGGSFGQDGGVAPTDPGSTCAHADVTFDRTVPTVWLMIDGSGSMGAALEGAGPSRYQALRDALMNGTNGLVFRLQASVAFGLYLYDGCAYDPSIVGPGCVAGACPRSVIVDPALGNYARIQARYPADPPGSSTPTDVALAALGRHIGANASTPAMPRYVILATDGEPNLCDWHDGIPSNAGFRANAVDAVKSMAASGTKVFAISLAGDDADLQSYLEEVAAAGGTGQHAFTTTNQGDLGTALGKVVGGAVSCNVSLSGTVTSGRECTGQVKLNGRTLPCDTPDGWSLKDAHTIELTGASCTSLRTDPSATLSATFPCDAYAPPK